MTNPDSKRQFLLRRSKPTIAPDRRIKNIHQLRKLLQEALELEHSTIPPYLCALYSIPQDSNQIATQIIRSVVMEEMLHMVLVANVLNAIKGEPSINHPKFIPEYPMKLDLIDDKLVVDLARFSPEAVETFVRIERPSQPDGQPSGCDCIKQFRTIGQFYEAIELGLIELSQRGNIFTGDRSRQITSEHYYGGGGKPNSVTDLESSMEALKEIVGQGEGVHHTIWDGDKEIGPEVAEVAHYFRFKEILSGRRYQAGDTPSSGPSGAPFNVRWDEAYPMRKNPKMADYAADTELRKKTAAFNQTYMLLLNELHLAANGKPERLIASVPIMYQMKYQATELIKIPTGNGDETAGPTFEYMTS